MALPVLPRRPRATPSPWSELETMEDRLQRLMGEFLPGRRETEAFGWRPAVELVEREEEFLLTAELPGLKRDDVEVEIEGDMLAIKGEKKSQREEKEGRRHVLERTYGAFERCFTLPRSVDPSAVTAEMKDGVLTVHLPKSGETRGRHVEISAE